MYGNRDRESDGFRSFAPVKQGEELEVTIEAVGAKGDGIAKKSGFVLFVAGAKEGQHVRIKITKVLRKVGFADLIGPADGSAPTEAPSQEAAQPEIAPEPSDSESFGEEEQ